MIPRNSNDNKNEQKLILDLDFFQKKKYSKETTYENPPSYRFGNFCILFPILLVNGMVFFR